MKEGKYGGGHFDVEKTPQKTKQKTLPSKKMNQEKQIAFAVSIYSALLPPRPHLWVPLHGRLLCFCVWSSRERRWAMVAEGCSGERKRCWEGLERRLALAGGYPGCILAGGCSP